MQGFKRVIAVTAILGMAVALAACKRHREEPLKLGAVDAPAAEQVVRV